MDKIVKFIKKLNKKERAQVAKVISALLSGRFNVLNIKKLEGSRDIYRARTGNLRIIFKKEADDIKVLDVSWRDESTYRDY